MGCFEAHKLPSLKSQPLQQIWRDHLLAGALKHVGADDDGFFAFLYPQGNLHCAGAVAQYRACLTNLNNFEDWTLEDLVSSIKRHTNEGWIKEFQDRYLNFKKLVNFV